MEPSDKGEGCEYVLVMSPSNKPLGGRYVFLSASVPHESQPAFYQFAGQTEAIDETVVGFVRALFSAGGRLVFGAHPSISPMIAQIAGEYVGVESGETPVGNAAAPLIKMYQSKVFEEHITRDSRQLHRLGLAEMILTEAASGEVFRRGHGTGGQQCPRSLKAMRHRMIDETQPIAMVCIGGMQGIHEEFSSFVDYKKGKDLKAPIYLLAYAGGATLQLAADPMRASIPDVVVITSDFFGRMSQEYHNLMMQEWQRTAVEGEKAVAPGQRFVPNQMLGVMVGRRIVEDLASRC
jgi:hypothetical protein